MKLYVGLSVNSICIWSDAINNLADALSCLVTLGFFWLTLRLGARVQPEIPVKGERLLSFLLSCVVAFVGASFAYSSLERLMYPTPVWFSVKFFCIVLLTALVKLGMFFFYRAFARKTQSDVLRVLQADSLMDCFITTATLLSFTLTRWLSFAVDAIFGLAISVFLFVGAAKLIASHLRALIGYVKKETRDAVEESLSREKALANFEKIQYDIGKNDAVTAFVTLPPAAFEDSETLRRLFGAIKEQTGVELRFILQTDQENQGRSGSDAAEENHV